MNDKIDLKEKDTISSNMVKEQEEAVVAETTIDDIKVPSPPKEDPKDKEKKKKKKKEIKKIKITIGEKSYIVPETMILDFSKKEHKIKEDTKRIADAQVAVLYMRESGIADLKYVKPENGMFIVEGRYYHIRDSCMYSIGKKRIPLAVIPEWSFVPLSKKGYKEHLGSENQEAQMLIIKSLENAEVVKIQQDGNPKGKTDGKLIIWILIAAVAGLFFLNKMFGAG